MTKVSITETYAIGCPECVENLIRLCQWSGRDSQVTGLTFRAVPRCEHALPVVKGKPERLAGKTVGEAFPVKAAPAEPTNPPPPHSAQLFAVAEMRPSEMAGTGYDEAHAG